MKIKLASGDVIELPRISLADKKSCRDLRVWMKMAEKLESFDRGTEEAEELEDKLELDAEKLCKTHFKDDFEKISVHELYDLVIALRLGGSNLDKEYTDFTDAPPQQA